MIFQFFDVIEWNARNGRIMFAMCWMWKVYRTVCWGWKWTQSRLECVRTQLTEHCHLPTQSPGLMVSFSLEANTQFSLWLTVIIPFAAHISVSFGLPHRILYAEISLILQLFVIEQFVVIQTTCKADLLRKQRHYCNGWSANRFCANLIQLRWPTDCSVLQMNISALPNLIPHRLKNQEAKKMGWKTRQQLILLQWDWFSAFSLVPWIHKTRLEKADQIRNGIKEKVD